LGAKLEIREISRLRIYIKEIVRVRKIGIRENCFWEKKVKPREEKSHRREGL
jgi:hypothetical protein